MVLTHWCRAANPITATLYLCDQATVHARSLRCLISPAWLTDDIIRGYGALLNQHERTRYPNEPARRSHCLSPLLWTQLVTNIRDPAGHTTLHYSFDLAETWLRRWGHQLYNGTPLAYNRLIMPLNRNGNHWACVAIDFAATTITYLDSLIPESWVGKYGREYTLPALRFIQDEHLRRFHCTDTREWILKGSTRDTVPQQTNGWDCGVYACLFADCVVRDQPLRLTPAQVHDARQHLTLAIIQGHLPSW